MRIKKFCNIFIFSVLLVFLLQGCYLTKKKYPDKNYYILDVTRDKLEKTKKPKSVLKISKFRLSPLFKGKGFIYRTGDLTYESDFYNEFLVSPDEMMTEAVMRWFLNSKKFKHVMVSPGHIESNYILESSITALYGDFIDKENPKAVIEINFTIIRDKRARYTIVLKNQYREEIPVAKGQISGLVKGWNQALKKILCEFENDLIKSKII